MKIKLIRTVPVGKEHGLVEGRVFEVVRRGETTRGNPQWYVIGDAGEEVGVLFYEADVIEEEQDAQGS